MKLITLTWKERGYSCPFYDTMTTLPRATKTVTRNLVAKARQNCGVYGLRVKISDRPAKS